MGHEIAAGDIGSVLPSSPQHMAEGVAAGWCQPGLWGSGVLPQCSGLPGPWPLAQKGAL